MIDLSGGVQELFGRGRLRQQGRVASPREELQTCTIVIRDADETMARLHNRMPVVLTREDEQAWLDPQLTIPSLVKILARSAGVPLDAYAVSRMVNKPSVDGKELIRPIE
jgi:putative SOS response-associated peptidase YedK